MERVATISIPGAAPLADTGDHGTGLRGRGGGRATGWQPGGVLLGWRRAARRGAGMALRYYCSGTARCHVCSGTGVQGDGRVCAICGGSGKCTHCSGGVMGRTAADPCGGG